MVYGKAEDAGGLSPAKDDNAAVRHFIRRTLPILGRVDYIEYTLGLPIRVTAFFSIITYGYLYWKNYLLKYKCVATLDIKNVSHRE